jgi:EmrB/QacA subfamily drug resistance transporter
VVSKSAVLVTLCLAALIINIDVTIVNVALPSLVRQLGATTKSLQWVVDSYTLVFAALILAAGSLSDRVGRKGVLLVGLGIFGVGSLAGALCETPNQLIAARAVMGIGAAGIFPATLSLIANVFTERAERAKAIGLWGATTGIGVATGPIVGGWLLERFWWGSVFLFMVPVAVVVAALVAWAVPTSRDPNVRPIDWPGLLLSSIGLGTLVFSIIEAPDWGWGSARTITTLVAALVIIAVFIGVERRTERPMMDVSLFRNPRFTAASGSITIGFFVLAGFTFLITQYFQFVKGYTPLGTGVRLLPVAGSIAVAAVVGTRLAVRFGNNVVVATGLALWGGAVLWISTVSPATSYVEIVGQMIMGGGGLGLITAPATEAIMGAVPTDKAGIGSAVNDATRLFGAALGVAVIGSIASSLYGSRLGTTIPHELPLQAAAAAKGSVGGALVAAKSLGAAGLAAPAQSLVTAAVGAFLHSLEGALRVAGGIGLLGAVMAAALLPARPRAAEHAVVTEDGGEPAPGSVATVTVPEPNGNAYRREAWVPGHRRLRDAPSVDAAVVGTVHGEVRIVGVNGDWVSVQRSELVGWLRRAFVQPVLPDEPRRVADPVA